jgi:hypothetical protein
MMMAAAETPFYAIGAALVLLAILVFIIAVIVLNIVISLAVAPILVARELLWRPRR